MQRNSFVDTLRVKTVIFGSNVIVGDSERIQMSATVLAIQRQQELYYGFEAPFQTFPIFSLAVPIPPVTEQIRFQVYHENPVIKVSNVDIIGMSNSTVMQVGSTKSIALEARVHHTRQLDPNILKLGSRIPPRTVAVSQESSAMPD